MIALFALLFIVAGCGLGAAWLGANPGMVTITWFDTQMETSVAVLLLLAIIAAIILTFMYNLLRRIFLAPSRFKERRSLKQYRLALTEVTHSVAALAVGDMDSASRYTKRAEKSLGTTPLTLLLRAQISKNAGSDEDTRKLLEQLLDHPETEYLAAKSLSDAAQKQHLLPKALQLAERAHRVNPKEVNGAWAVFNLHLDAEHFQEAEAHARNARKVGAFSRADMTKAKGKIALKQATNSYTNGNKANAFILAKQAVEALHGDIDAAELCAELYVESNKPRKALGLIQEQWKTLPSAKLAKLFLEITADEKPAKKEKLIEKLIASNGAAAENLLLG